MSLPYPGEMHRALLSVLTLASVSAPAAAANAWVGVNATTSGYGVHAGAALVRVPLIGTVGLEASMEPQWNSPDWTTDTRYAAGLTLRDINLPLTGIDAFASVGAEVQNFSGTSGVATGYAEGGLRGPLLGPAGWRAFVRVNTASQFGGGLGLELRF